ncbi:MAG: serine protease [Phycisphaerales bacterium]|nr:MAG: serine protease [Phycisphaerales bacterium]
MPACLLAALLATLLGCTPVGLTVRLGPVRDDLVPSPVMELGQGPGRPSHRVAMVLVRGIITETPSPGLLGQGRSALDELAEQLQLAAKDPRVVAVVLRIDSPGGSVAGSETAYREVRAFTQTTGKPVVVSLGEVATSGGYFLALAGDHILAEPSTLTGSIGVLIPTLNASEGLARIGVYARPLTSGPNKDLANPLTPPRPEHEQILQAIVHEFHNRFVSHVLRHRPTLDPRHVAQATDGRVMTGQTAAAIGLVDGLGDIRQAAEKAMTLAGVDHAVLVRYGPKASAPRTAYAQAQPDQPLAIDRSVSLLHLDGLGAAAMHLGLRPGVGYYLWLP